MNPTKAMTPPEHKRLQLIPFKTPMISVSEVNERRESTGKIVAGNLYPCLSKPAL